MPVLPLHVRTVRRALVAVAAAFALASTSHAVGDPPMLIIQSFGAVMSRSVLTYPLREGVFQTKFAPSYVTVNGDTRQPNGGGMYNKMSGYGLTSAVTYGFTDHWGASLLVGYTNISGDRSVSFRDNNGALIMTPPAKAGGLNGPQLVGAGQGHGIVATASAVWDHWDGDGFRLPVYLGGGIMSISEQADHAGLGIKRVADVTSPALLVGVAPSFNLWDFRAVTYFLVTAALNPGTGSIIDYNPRTGATNSRTNFPLVGGLDSAFPIAGIELTYKPWGLGVTYAPDIQGEGAQSYGLKWSREWGGKAK